jgi:hypothetical protein
MAGGSDRTTGILERMTGHLARRGERAAGHIHPRTEPLGAAAQIPDRSADFNRLGMRAVCMA